MRTLGEIEDAVASGRARTYDTKCHDLAAHFLSDEPDLNTEAAKATLAAAIQQAVEDEIEFMRAMMEKA
jgi:hypothetical protein